MQHLSLKDNQNWVGLESNPEVLTEYAHKLGVDKSWGFSDVVGLDEEALKMVPEPCLGLIFLYPFSQLEAHKRKRGRDKGRATDGVWFMSQTIGNACGAVALMHTVMNCMAQVSKGSGGKLAGFAKDAESVSPHARGKLFGSAMRELHDGVAAQGQTDAPKPNADLDFHFISLVSVDGTLFELDGNNDGPINCGAIEPGEGGFIRCAIKHVQKEYIAPFPDSHFSAIALGPCESK